LPEHLSSLSGDQQDQIDKELRAIMRKRPGDRKWRDSPEEWISEFFKGYLVDPEGTKRTAPLTASLVRKLWNENERVNKLLILSQEENSSKFA
jgi:hypothetical protein